MNSRSKIVFIIAALLIAFFLLTFIQSGPPRRVERRLNLGGTMICFNALRAGDLDIYVEYTGTGLMSILERDVIADPDEAYDVVKEEFEEKYGLIWLDPLGFNNSYTLTMRRSHAEELGIETISDLASYIAEDNGDLDAGFDAEFIERSDGYTGLSEHYGFEIPGSIRQMDPGLMYRAVKDGNVDVINAFATDGRIPAYDLVVLEDDLRFFPPYYAAPLVRRDTLEENPFLKDLVNKLGSRISDKQMQELNFKVDEEDVPAREVAADFLSGSGIITPETEGRYNLEGTVTVGSKHFTEQEILGEILAQLIEGLTSDGDF